MATVARRGGVGLLVPGSPLVLRLDRGLRATLMPPLTGEDARSLFDELGAPPDEVSRHRGHSVVEVGFGDAHRFQVTAVGEPSPRALLLAETKLTRLPLPSRERSRGDQIWLTSTWHKSLDGVLRSTVPESVWLPGCPPLVHTSAGFVAAAKCLALSEGDFSELVASLHQHTPPGESPDGFTTMYMRHGKHGDRFTVSIFGEPTPTLLIFMRWPDDAPDDPPRDLPNPRR